MEFRPCIDIHNGSVKQIVGGNLKDQNDEAVENYVAEQDAAFYARLYREYQIRNGHIILLNPVTSPYYKETKNQAVAALRISWRTAGRRRYYTGECWRVSGRRGKSCNCNFVCF